MSEELNKKNAENAPGVPCKTFALLKLSFVVRRRRIFLIYMLVSLFSWVGSILVVISFLRPYFPISDWYYFLVIVYMFLLCGILCASWFIAVHLLGLTCPNCGADFMNFNIGPPNESDREEAIMVSSCGKCGAEIVDLEG